MAKTASPEAPATVFTWKISQLERETADGLVIVAHYLADAKSGDSVYSAGAYGSIGFERPEGELIPYADLTEDLVVSWVKEKLGDEAVANVEAALQQQLDDQRSPRVAAGVPWAN